MNYNSIPYNNFVREKFTHIRQSIRSAPNTVRAFAGKTSSTTNLHAIMTMAAYFTGTHLCIRDYHIARNDNVGYFFDNIINNTLRRESYINTYEIIPYDEANDIPYTYLDLDIVYAKNQITETFEHVLPQKFSAENGYIELTGCSLALKQTPRHRVRVYAKDVNLNNITIRKIVVVTAMNPYEYETDMLLFRKILALIPLFDNRTETAIGEVQQNRIAYFRAIENTNDADEYLNSLYDYISELSVFKNLETLETLAVLKTLNDFHQSSLNNRLATQQNTINRILEQLTNALNEQRQLQYERAGMSDAALSDNDFKMLIDKNILIKPQLNNNKLTYLCQAPCLSFDKDAARVYYRRLDETTTYAKLFKLAFIDEKIILMFTDVITIDFTNIMFSGQTVPSSYGFDFTCLRNPHHKHYNCWGNYSSTIIKLIQQYSFMQLFLQIKAAVGSINLLDYTVLSRFVSDISNHVSLERNNQNMPGVIVWKEEHNMSKLHSIHETIEHFKEGENNNETN